MQFKDDICQQAPCIIWHCHNSKSFYLGIVWNQKLKFVFTGTLRWVSYKGDISDFFKVVIILEPQTSIITSVIIIIKLFELFNYFFNVLMFISVTLYIDFWKITPPLFFFNKKG